MKPAEFRLHMTKQQKTNNLQYCKDGNTPVKPHFLSITPGYSPCNGQERGDHRGSLIWFNSSGLLRYREIRWLQIWVQSRWRLGFCPGKQERSTV
jgi:hypothetical protein